VGLSFAKTKRPVDFFTASDGRGSVLEVRTKARLA